MDNTLKKILLMDNDAEERDQLVSVMTKAGYEITTALDIRDCLNILSGNEYDLVIIEVLKPDEIAVDFCERIHRETKTQIIIMTEGDNRNEETKLCRKISDMLVIRPSFPGLVLLFTESLIGKGNKAEPADLIRYHDLEISESAHSVTVSGKDVFLSPLEFQILLRLVKYKGCVFTRDQFLELLWEYDIESYEYGMNYHIAELQRKINAKYIRRVRRMGYRVIP